MITIYSLKPQFQRALQPLLNRLAKAQVTPNQVTLFTTILSIAFGIYFTWAGLSSWWLMPIVLLVRMALNAIDGMLARQFQLQSRLGVYLNEMGDMVSDLVLFLPFIVAFPVVMGIVAFLSVLTEVAGILGVVVGRERRYDGPMGKSDRAFCLGCIGLVISIGWIDAFWGEVMLAAMVPLLCLTLISRVKHGLK
jgi:CDP-diacylglycerol---glycerol-3-phosphate 3-phosphatidyltransferase